MWWDYIESKLSACYWERLSNRYHKRDLHTRWVLAVTSGSTFAGLGVWKIVSFLTFLLAATHAFVNWQKSENDLSRLHEKHSIISLRYKDLLMDMETGLNFDKAKEEYKQIQYIEKALNDDKCSGDVLS